MIREPKLSVVVPAYNVQEYLADCLWSILKQDFKDLEVIVVNDASPDNVGAIADEFARRDSRVRVIHHPVNRGLGAARNSGLDHARGEYITFPDSDDIVADGAYGRMVSVLDETGSDFGTGPAEEFGRRRKRYWTTDGEAFDYPAKRVTLAEYPGLIEDHTAWTKVFRRNFLHNAEIRWPEDVKCEDVVPSAAAYVKATAVDVFSDIVYHYRRRSGSITTALGAGAALSDWVEQSAKAFALTVSAPRQARARLANKILVRELLTSTRLEALSIADPGVVEAAGILVTELVQAADSADIMQLTPTDKWRLAHIAAGNNPTLAEVTAQTSTEVIDDDAGNEHFALAIPSSLRAAMGIDAAERAMLESGHDDATADSLQSADSSNAIELSVVIPTYNVATYVDELLRSVRAAVGVRLEIIIVDDGSTDGTWERVQRHASDDPRVRALRSPGAGGGQARNAGVELARGEYLAFADGDDIVPRDAYRIMLETAQRTRADIVTGKHLKFFTTSTWDPTDRLYPLGSRTLDGTLADLPQLIHPRTVWNRLFNRRFWIDHALPYPGVPRANDIVPFTSALVAASRVMYVPIVTYIYRDRPGRGAMTAKLGSVASTVSFLSEELTCVQILASSSSDAASIKHWDVLLQEDGWGNLGHYLASQEGVGFTDNKVSEWVARLLEYAPKKSVRKLSPERQLVWLLISRGRLVPAANLYRADREALSIPFDQVLELMHEIADLQGTPDRVIHFLLWKYVMRRAIDHRDELSPSLAHAIIEVLGNTRRGSQLTGINGSFEGRLAKAAQRQSIEAILALGDPAPKHPDAVFFPRNLNSGIFVAPSIPGAIVYRGLQARRRGVRGALPVPLAIVDYDAESSRWRAEVETGRLPEQGTWEVWVEYEDRFGIRQVPLPHLVMEGSVISTAVAAQVVDLDGADLRVRVAANPLFPKLVGLNLTSANESYDLGMSQPSEGEAVYVGRIALDSLVDSEHHDFTINAMVETPYGAMSYPLALDASMVATRASIPMLVVVDNLLRFMFTPRQDAESPSFGEQYLSARVSRIELSAGQITLHVVPGAGATVTGVRLWRDVGDGILTRDFEVDRRGDGALVATRSQIRLENRRWIPLVMFETPSGRVESRVSLAGALVVNEPGRANARTHRGNVLQIIRESDIV